MKRSMFFVSMVLYATSYGMETVTDYTPAATKRSNDFQGSPQPETKKPKDPRDPITSPRVRHLRTNSKDLLNGYRFEKYPKKTCHQDAEPRNQILGIVSKRVSPLKSNSQQ